MNIGVGLISSIHQQFPSVFCLGERSRVGLLRSGSSFNRVKPNSSLSSSFAVSASSSSISGSGQLLGEEPQKKWKKIAGIDQDELVDPAVLADPDSCFCEFNGVKIHHKVYEADSTQKEAQDLGPAELSSQVNNFNFPMILLHGFGASLFSWHRIMKPLAQIARSKVLAFDRPAFGLTSRVNPYDIKPLNPYSMIFSVLATLSFIDLLSAEKAVLMGHSAGSLVAVNTYFEAPERVAALILVAPAIVAPLIERNIAKENNSKTDVNSKSFFGRIYSILSKITPFLRLYSIFSRISMYVIHAIMHLVKGMGDMISSFYKRALSALLRSALGIMLIRVVIDKFGTAAVKNAWCDQNQVTEHILEGYTKPLKIKGWDKALAEYTAATLTDSSSESKPSISNRLHEISCPVLIITGDQDRLVPSWNSVRLAKAIPGSSLEIIKSCGHLPHEEKPEEFLSVVDKFLREAFTPQVSASFVTDWLLSSTADSHFTKEEDRW